ncbi:MAG: NAD-dependent protein deacylase, partial [Acidobacteriota bacterium]|nr:NAD-dependent protein deacylase [Acidobacteriota bacterium]
MGKPDDRQRKSVSVLTGAGVSAESGVPTFRSGGKSMGWKGMPFEVISSAAMVRENLDEVWEWFDYRRGEYAHCAPNPAHHALAAIERACESFTLATQNVDGLHRQAGSQNIVELHGSVERARCVSCEKKYELEQGRVPHHPFECSV